MKHRSWNLRTSDPTSFDVRGVIWFVFLAVAVLVSTADGTAAEKLSGSLLAPDSRSRATEDRAVEIRVRIALAKDAQLGPLNLGVRMTRGTAHLFGPVPSAEFLVQAKAIVQEVPGVLEVHTSDIYFAKRRGGTKALTLPIEDGKPTQTRSASPNPLSATLGNLTGRDPLTLLPSEQNLLTRPTPRPRASVAMAVQPVSSVPTPISLLAPEAVTTSPRVPEPARLTANPRPTAPTVSIQAAIDRLRQRDGRFRSIRTEVRGTTVRIYTGENPSEMVMAFAQAIARLAGVHGIIMQDTSSDPR